MKNINRPQDIDNSTPPPKKTLDIVCPLPVLFLCSVLIIAVLNMTNFFTSYKTAMEEKPNNKQAALSSIETKYTSSFAGKTNYVDINGLFSRLVDKKEMNDVVRLENGYLIGLSSSVDVIPYAEKTAQFQEYLNLFEIPFFYVQAPTNFPFDNSLEIPVGYETFSNRNADQYLEKLEEFSVPFLDLRSEIQSDDLDHYEMFPKTDHHWKPETAFWAHEKIANYIDFLLADSYANPEFFNPENYTIITYPNMWLGSRGTRTGIFFGGTDDFSIYIPDFETNLRGEVASKSYDKQGSFEISMMRTDILSKNELLGRKYDAYATIPFQSGYCKITNFLSTNDLKIAILMDSFTSALAPYLALHYKEIYLINSRNVSDEPLLAQLEEISPDIVIQIVSAGQYDLYPSHFNYLTDNAINLLKQN